MFYCNAIVWYIILTDRKEWPKNVITVYILGHLKLLPLVVCFAELVYISLWAIWAEQHAPYPLFLSRPARKESNEPRLKSS